jgi:hypothetical protein
MRRLFAAIVMAAAVALPAGVLGGCSTTVKTSNDCQRYQGDCYQYRGDRYDSHDIHERTEQSRSLDYMYDSDPDLSY